MKYVENNNSINEYIESWQSENSIKFLMIWFSEASIVFKCLSTCLSTTHILFLFQKSIIVENLEQLPSSDDLARHSQLPSSIRVSPSSHLSQSLYLATSQADIYRWVYF